MKPPKSPTENRTTSKSLTSSQAGNDTPTRHVNWGQSRQQSRQLTPEYLRRQPAFADLPVETLEQICDTLHAYAQVAVSVTLSLDSAIDTHSENSLETNPANSTLSQLTSKSLAKNEHIEAEATGPTVAPSTCQHPHHPSQAA